MITDKEIVQFVKLRNEQGLRLLYKHYSKALYGISYRVLNNEAFAEDALQQSMLKIWNNIDQYDSDKSILFTWMSNIVRNTAIDIRRLKSFEKESKTISIEPNVYKGEVVSDDHSKMDIDYLLSKVDEKYSIILEHLYLKGYSQSELAEKLDLPIGTIKTRVKKAIDLLRDHLRGEEKTFFGLFSWVTLINILILLLWI